MKNTLFILLFFISTSIGATTYYVDPSGSDSNNGSGTSPWKTIAYACSKTVSGDVIHINAGTYSITSKIVLPVGISIEGDGVTSIITSTTLTAEWTPLIDMESSPASNGNQEIRNLMFDGNSLSAAQAIWITGRHNVKIHDCTFINFNYLAVYWAGIGGDENGTPPTTYLTGSEFYNNTVTNCSAYASGYARGALYIGGQDGMLIYNNNISQTGRAAGTNGWPIKMWGNGGWTKGLKIYNNTLFKDDNSVWDFCIEGNYHYGLEIYGNNITGTIDLNTIIKGSYAHGAYIHDNTIGQASVTSNPVAGITLEFGLEDVLIERNLMKNTSPPFLFTPRSQAISGVTIQYNICPGIANVGGMYGIARFLGGNGWTLTGFNVYNNVFYSSSTGNPYGIIMDSEGSSYTANNINIINNIIVGFDTYWLYLSGASATSNLSVENNIIYNCGNSNLPNYNGTPSNYTYSNNLVGSNPLVTSSTDFHLQAGSPAINGGMNVSLATDFAGNTVRNPPDIGAYEYGGSQVAPPAVPVYQSSVVQNATPNLLEMTYSLSLNNLIIPASSAFSVSVNSTARAVSTVAISGTKVQLTLASAVKFGDVITVTYTKPAINPLQTSAGGMAINISAQSTTNNLINSPKDTGPVTVTMTIFPYHVHRILNVLLAYSSIPTTALSPEIITISDLSGYLFVKKSLTTGATNLRIPLNLASGIYNVVMIANNVQMASQKITVY